MTPVAVADPPSTGQAEKDVVRQAIDRLRLAADATKRQCEREKDALKFQVPEEQWTEEARNARKGQTVGGVTIPARPILSISKLDQPIQIELNKERDAHLGVKITPLSEDADDETAEVQQGLYRRIETDSRANLARSWAFERAVKAGRGAYRILTEYDPSSPPEMNDQRIVIKRILYQEAVFKDPFAIEPDRCDAEWGMVASWMAWSKYKRIHKTKKRRADDGKETDIASVLAGYGDSSLDQLSIDCPDWVKGEGEARAVLVVEYFTLEGPEEARTVKWRKMNAVEVLEEQRFPGRYIPIVDVVGRELIPFDGERRWMGIIEPNMDAQRFFNYSASTVVENMAQEPKATWVIAEGQEEGHEQEFLMANVRNFPYVRYKPTALQGMLVPGPQRSQVDTSKLALAMQGVAVAGEFIHSGTGYFDPSLGKSNPNVRTKGGTLALQDQTDRGNSNWLDNLVNISLEYEAKVILAMMPEVYDRPGRIARLLGVDDEARTVMLNQPFTPGQGSQRPQALPYGNPQEQAQAMQMVRDPNHPAKMFDLRQGSYGVVASVGKSYKSRVDAGKDQLGQLFSAAPELMKIGGDIYFKFADFPGHEVLAERFAKMLPPPLQDKKDQQDPQVELDQAKQMIAQMQQALEEMRPERMKAEVDIALGKAKAEADLEKTRITAEKDIRLQEMKDATSIAVAQINASVKVGQMATESQNEALATGLQHAHEAAEAEKDREHDAAMAAAQAQQTADASASAQAHDAEMGQQGHQQNLEAAEQAAALAPPPTEGAE